MTIVAAIIGLYMTACTLVITVWGFQRLITKRQPDPQILALEARIQQLEMAVTEARRSLQPQDSRHVHNLHTLDLLLGGVGVKCDECGYVEQLENPWPSN